MKKIYQKPNIEITEMEVNSILCASLSIDDNHDIDNEGGVWSNQESDFNVWE